MSSEQDFLAGCSDFFARMSASGRVQYQLPVGRNPIAAHHSALRDLLTVVEMLELLSWGKRHAVGAIVAREDLFRSCAESTAADYDACLRGEREPRLGWEGHVGELGFVARLAHHLGLDSLWQLAVQAILRQRRADGSLAIFLAPPHSGVGEALYLPEAIIGLCARLDVAEARECVLGVWRYVAESRERLLAGEWLLAGANWQLQMGWAFLSAIEGDPGAAEVRLVPSVLDHLGQVLHAMTEGMRGRAFDHGVDTVEVASYAEGLASHLQIDALGLGAVSRGRTILCEAELARCVVYLLECQRAARSTHLGGLPHRMGYDLARVDVTAHAANAVRRYAEWSSRRGHR